MYDVIIIGAGVTGCAVARYLSRYQSSALVLERAEDVCCGTSKANSAIIHAGFDAAHGSLMAKMNVQGNRMVPGLAKELECGREIAGGETWIEARRKVGREVVGNVVGECDGQNVGFGIKTLSIII